MNRVNWLRQDCRVWDVTGLLLFCPRLTTVLTITMTTFGLPDTLNYATVELASCLVTPSARAYGSEGSAFESLRAGGLTPYKSAV